MKARFSVITASTALQGLKLIDDAVNTIFLYAIYT